MVESLEGGWEVLRNGDDLWLAADDSEFPLAEGVEAVPTKYEILLIVVYFNFQLNE